MSNVESSLEAQSEPNSSRDLQATDKQSDSSTNSQSSQETSKATRSSDLSSKEILNSSTTGVSSSPASNTSTVLKASASKKPSNVAHVSPFSRSGASTSEAQQIAVLPLPPPLKTVSPPNHTDLQIPPTHSRSLDFSTSELPAGTSPTSYLPPDAISVFHTLVSSAIDQCLHSSSQSKFRVSVFSSLFDTVSRSSLKSNSPALCDNPDMTSTQTRNAADLTSTAGSALFMPPKRRNGVVAASPSMSWAKEKDNPGEGKGEEKSPLGSPIMLRIDEDDSEALSDTRESKRDTDTSDDVRKSTTEVSETALNTHVQASTFSKEAIETTGAQAVSEEGKTASVSRGDNYSSNPNSTESNYNPNPKSNSDVAASQDLASSSSSSDMVNRLTKYLLEQHLFNGCYPNSNSSTCALSTDASGDTATAKLMAATLGDKREIASAVANAAVAALTSRDLFRSSTNQVLNVTPEAHFSGPYSTPSPKLIGTPPPLTKEEPLNLSTPSPCSLYPNEQKIKVVMANEDIRDRERFAATSLRDEASERKTSPEVIAMDTTEVVSSGKQMPEKPIKRHYSSDDIVKGILSNSKNLAVNGAFGSVTVSRSVSPTLSNSNSSKTSEDETSRTASDNPFTKMCHNIIRSEIMKLSTGCEHAIEKKINLVTARTSNFDATISDPSKSNSAMTANQQTVHPTVALSKIIHASFTPKEDSLSQSKSPIANAIIPTLAGMFEPEEKCVSGVASTSPNSDFTQIHRLSDPTTEQVNDLTSELHTTIAALCPATKWNKSQIHSVVTACMYNSTSFAALKMLSDGLKERQAEYATSSNSSSNTIKRKLTSTDLPRSSSNSSPPAKSVKSIQRDSPTGSQSKPPTSSGSGVVQLSSPPSKHPGRPPTLNFSDDPPRLLPYSNGTGTDVVTSHHQLAAAVASLTAANASHDSNAHHYATHHQRAQAPTQLHGSASVSVSGHHPNHHHSVHSAAADNVAAIHARLAAAGGDYRTQPFRHPASQHTPPGHASVTSPHAAALAAASHAHHGAYGGKLSSNGPFMESCSCALCVQSLQKSAVVAQAAALMKSQHSLGHHSPSLHPHSPAGVPQPPSGSSGGPGSSGHSLSASVSLPPPHHTHSMTDSLAQYHSAAAEQLRLFQSYPGGGGSHVPKLLPPPAGSATSQGVSAATAGGHGHRSPILASSASALKASAPGGPQSHYPSHAAASAGHYSHAASLAAATPTAHDIESQVRTMHHHTAAALGRFAPHLGSATGNHQTDPTTAAILAFHQESQRKAAAAAAINAAALQQQQQQQHHQQLQPPPQPHPFSQPQHRHAPSSSSRASPHSLAPSHHPSYIASAAAIAGSAAVAAAAHAAANSGQEPVSNHSRVMAATAAQLRAMGAVTEAAGDASSAQAAPGQTQRPLSGSTSQHQQSSKPAGSQCANCGGEAIYLCSGCRKIWYCSQECQVKAWERHYVDCFGSQNR